MSDVFVVTDGTSYLSWDDKGALSTGYPNWTTLDAARQYRTRASAEHAAEAAWRCDKDKRLFTETLTLTTSGRLPYTPVELDPEWGEYNRLKEKFKNK